MYKMNVSEEKLSELILYYQINPLFEKEDYYTP